MKQHQIAITSTLLCSLLLSGCAQVNSSLDKLDRMAIERMEEAKPIVEKGTIDMPFEQVVSNFTQLPVEEVKKQSTDNKRRDDEWIVIRPPKGMDPGVWGGGVWDSPTLLHRSSALAQFVPDGRTSVYKNYEHEFKYEDGYPANKCKTACKISILLKPTSDGKTISHIEYSGDGDISVFTKAMRRMIRNVLKGKPADAPEESDLSKWIGINI